MTLIEGFRDAREKYGEPKNPRTEKQERTNPTVIDERVQYVFGKAYGIRRKKRCVCPICGEVIDCSLDACECGSTEPGVWC